MTAQQTKQGTVVHIYGRDINDDSDVRKKKMAEISPDGELILSKDISLQAESEVMFLYQNLVVLSEQNSQTRERISFFVPDALLDDYLNAYQLAKKNKIEFNPAQKMYKALRNEIQAVIQANDSKKKHLGERVIFEKLVDMGKKHFSNFAEIAKLNYGKKDLPTNFESWKHYQTGGGKPRGWELAAALEAIAEANFNIFALGISLEAVLKLWFDGNKAQYEGDDNEAGEAMADRFIELFHPEDSKLVRQKFEEMWLAYQELKKLYPEN